MLKKTHSSLSKRHVERGLHPIISGFNSTLSHAFKGTSGEHHPTLGKYYRVNAEAQHHDAIVLQLRSHPHVETAYVMPPLMVPEMKPSNFERLVRRPLEKQARAPGATPNMSNKQAGMFGPASQGGMDINYAHSQPGGWGDGVQVFQVEGNWLRTHEDLKDKLQFVGPDGPIGSHATGAAGVVGADRNGIGIDGIAANSVMIARSVSHALGLFRYVS